eukprot:gene12387-biopygen8817
MQMRQILVIVKAMICEQLIQYRLLLYVCSQVRTGPKVFLRENH